MTRQSAIGDWMMVRRLVMVHTLLMVGVLKVRRRPLMSRGMAGVLRALGVADLSERRYGAEHNGENKSR
jgi:hypothetical protein